MKILSVLLASLFILSILLIAGFQLLGILFNGLAEMVAGVWHGSEISVSK